MDLNDRPSRSPDATESPKQGQETPADSPSALAGLSDNDLVRRYKAGEEQAFVTLVERYRTEIYHFLLRFVRQNAPAEDIFQDTFLQIHLSIDSFDLARPFKPWLLTIAANKARDYLRRNNQRQKASLSAAIDEGDSSSRSFVDLMDAGLALPDDEASLRETQGLVREVVGSLPEHLREILVMAYFHHLPYKEIADTLSIPLGTVKSRLHAAVGTFAQQWKLKYRGSETP